MLLWRNLFICGSPNATSLLTNHSYYANAARLVKSVPIFFVCSSYKPAIFHQIHFRIRWPKPWTTSYFVVYKRNLFTPTHICYIKACHQVCRIFILTTYNNDNLSERKKNLSQKNLSKGFVFLEVFYGMEWRDEKNRAPVGDKQHSNL